MTREYPNQLRIARKRHGLSRKQVAFLLGCDPTTVSRLERGSLLPRLPTALRLEALYRTPVAYLYPELSRTLRDTVREEEPQKEGAPGIQEPPASRRASP